MSINFFGAINLLNLTKNRNNTVLLIGHKLVGNLEIIFKENIENISVLYITLNFKDYIDDNGHTSNVTLPTDSGVASQVPVGMWHQYGELPGQDEFYAPRAIAAGGYSHHHQKLKGRHQPPEFHKPLLRFPENFR